MSLNATRRPASKQDPAKKTAVIVDAIIKDILALQQKPGQKEAANLEVELRVGLLSSNAGFLPGKRSMLAR